MKNIWGHRCKMRVVVDINHPGHVHYFKNFIQEMRQRSHDIVITASHKDVTIQLLQQYGLGYIDLGSYGSSLLEKMVNIPVMDIEMYRAVRNFRPDILLGFSSIRAAHASKVLGIPAIIFDDTEHAAWEHYLYAPFANVILTPNCFHKNLGEKQIRFNGYMELASLHPNRFTPNPAVLAELDLVEGDPFIIVRFVSWQASHDIGHSGLTLDTKRKAIHEFEKYGHVFITSEKPLPEKFEKYRVSIPPEKMHDLLYYATLLYGESATMASECAVLGTHAIFCDFAGRGYTDEEEGDYDLVYNFRLDESNQEKSIEKAVELLRDPNLKEKGREKQKRLLNDKIDVTAFMVWFIENYPESVVAMKKNPKKRFT